MGFNLGPRLRRDASRLCDADHPVRVTTGQRNEFDWLVRGGLAHLFPQEWDRLLNWLPREDRDGDIVEAYRQWLNNPNNPAIREPAALEWCMWESSTPEWPPSSELAKRFADPDYWLAFARIVTHYASHDAWLQDEFCFGTATG